MASARKVIPKFIEKNIELELTPLEAKYLCLMIGEMSGEDAERFIKESSKSRDVLEDKRIKDGEEDPLVNIYCVLDKVLYGYSDSFSSEGYDET